MARSISYTMEFKPERSGSVTPDFLGLVDRIMQVIRKLDQMLGNSLGYEITFHSMLASIEANSFMFQVDMEIELPQQLILGDPMTAEGVPHWFSSCHETLVHYLSGRKNMEQTLSGWESVVDQYRCRESFLFRPLEEHILEELKDRYFQLLEQEHKGMKFYMKKIA